MITNTKSQFLIGINQLLPNSSGQFACNNTTKKY